MTLVACQLHHFLLLASAFGAFIGKNLKVGKVKVNAHFQSVCWVEEGGKKVSRETFLFLWAGSDLQSLSMCSPTLMSGISPLLMGMGVLHSGHTGT